MLTLVSHASDQLLKPQKDPIAMEDKKFLLHLNS
uniref:Uncharacterized protein n=1 Tax=Rhizophora mucronata TaxID=61149 RepID=A0A2P2PGL6_RHIMU